MNQQKSVNPSKFLHQEKKNYGIKSFIKCRGMFLNTMDTMNAFKRFVLIKFKLKRLKISYIFCKVV